MSDKITCPFDLRDKPEEKFWERIQETKGIPEGKIEVARILVNSLADEEKFCALLNECVSIGDINGVKSYQGMIQPLRGHINKLLNDLPDKRKN